MALASTEGEREGLRLWDGLSVWVVESGVWECVERVPEWDTVPQERVWEGVKEVGVREAQEGVVWDSVGVGEAVGVLPGLKEGEGVPLQVAVGDPRGEAVRETVGLQIKEKVTVQERVGVGLALPVAGRERLGVPEREKVWVDLGVAVRETVRLGVETVAVLESVALGGDGLGVRVGVRERETRRVVLKEAEPEGVGGDGVQEGVRGPVGVSVRLTVARCEVVWLEVSERVVLSVCV